MKKYEILLRELDRCEYIVDYQYTGNLSDYTYNNISFEQQPETYFQILESMYCDFLVEWASLSDAERKSARGLVEFIVAKRFICGTFFFDVPTSEMIDSMANDRGVSRQSVEIARFVHEMAERQKFYLERVSDFMEIVLEREELHLNPVEQTECEVAEVVEVMVEDDEEDDDKPNLPTDDKEWITYAELIQMFDFRGVKSAKDANWRKRNGFEKCISQSGGAGSAVKYSVSKIIEWLNCGGKLPKKK